MNIFRFNALSSKDDKTIEPILIMMDNVTSISYYEGNPNITCVTYTNHSWIKLAHSFDEIERLIYKSI